MDVTIQQRLATRCGRAVAISLFVLFVLPSHGSATPGSYSTFPIPIQVDDQDVAARMYLRVREKRYDREMRSIIPGRGDREDAFARRIWESIHDGNVSGYASLWGKGLQAKARSVFPYRVKDFDDVGSEHIVWRYDVGNVTYFAIDDHPGDGRFTSITILKDGRTLTNGRLVRTWGVMRMVMRFPSLRDLGRSEFGSVTLGDAGYLKVKLTLRYSLSEDGKPWAKLVDNGTEAGNTAYVLLKAKKMDVVSSVEAVEAAGLTGEAKEVLLAYAGSRQAVREDNYDAFVATFSKKSQPWVREWLKDLGSAGWKMLMHKSGAPPQRVRVLIDARPVWIVVHTDHVGAAYPGPMLVYDMLVKDEETHRFVRTHFHMLGAVDAILSDPAFFTAFAHQIGLPTRCEGPLCVPWPGD